MPKFWMWVGNVVLGSAGRMSRVAEGLIDTGTPTASAVRPTPLRGHLPVIRKPFTVIEGGRAQHQASATPAPMPPAPQRPERRAG